MFHLLYRKIKFLIMNINIDDPALCASYMLVIIKSKHLNDMSVHHEHPISYSYTPLLHLYHPS